MNYDLYRLTEFMHGEEISIKIFFKDARTQSTYIALDCHSLKSTFETEDYQTWNGRSKT